MKQQTTRQTKTATPNTTPQSAVNIVNIMLWMKKNAYEESTIKKVAKLLRHLQKNCNTSEPEEVKMAYSNVKGKGTLGPLEVVTLILSGGAMPMEVETGKKIATILKKYPAQYELLKKAVQLMIDQLSQLIAD